MRYLLIIGLSMSLYGISNAQVVDQIDGIVDKNIILRSEVESQIQLLINQGEKSENLYCEVFDQMLMGKLLVAQAAIDSIIVAEEEVESELDRKINYYISIIGGKKEFEEYYGKSVDQIKDDFRGDIKDQLVAARMRQTIVGDIEITPSEVRTYFNGIPKDSLPYFNTELELSQIVITAKVNPIQREETKQKAEDIRNRIIAGEDFNTFCRLYSEDLASVADNCELGLQPRGTFVSEFEAAAWNLKEGETSQVVETQYGYHILQLVERKGELINIRHILIQAKTTSEDLALAKNKLDSLRNLILNDTLSFFMAVKDFSDDKYSKDNGGVILSQTTGGTTLEADDLEPSDFFIVDTMKVGQITEPLLFMTQDGKEAYRLIKVDGKTPPHIANLEDDWDKIYEVAKNFKQNETLERYIKKKARKTYIMIDDRYKSCAAVASWVTSK
ncbi:MAG: peptidylprolyl isomerase [Chitinophagales bacterium]